MTFYTGHFQYSFQCDSQGSSSIAPTTSIIIVCGKGGLRVHHFFKYYTLPAFLESLPLHHLFPQKTISCFFFFFCFSFTHCSKHHFHDFSHICHTLYHSLNSFVLAFDSTDQSVDILDLFNKMALEVILSTAFGVDAKIQMGENFELLREANNLLRIPQVIRQLTRLPLGKFVLRFVAELKGTRRNYLQGVAEDIVKSRRQQGFTERRDLLQLMMEANVETTNQGVTKLTDEEVVGQSLVFLIAGYETSSTTLGIALYHLALNQDIQDKVRSEIKEAMEASENESTLNEIVSSIEYLDCIIKETLRLNPPAPFVNRECTEDYNHDGIHIPAGTEIIIPIYALHHDPDAWDEPEKFDPERFRGPANDTRHAFQHLPFGAGPRNCIGMRFAILEIKIALVKILMKYKFLRSPETQVPLIIHPGLTLSPRDGVHVRVASLS